MLGSKLGVDLSEGKLPLISVVITNYNYGEFLKSAVDSVFNQSYPNIECIVVDDCSTDGSVSVLGYITAERPEIQIIRSDNNEGQSASIVKGLKLARGEFVVFLDADDVLLSEFMATHLSVHYSSRVAVGFTCCDSLQEVNGVLSAGRNGSLSAAFLEIPANCLIASSSPLYQLQRVGLQLMSVPSEALRYVSWKNESWPWSTTSCMMFRRSIVTFICEARNLKDMRIGSDNYMARAVNWMTGSIVIDRQLVQYRIHSKNGFSKRLHLNGTITYDRSKDHGVETIKIFLDDVCDRIEKYIEIIDSPSRFVLLFAVLNLQLSNSDNAPGEIQALEGVVRRNREKWLLVFGASLFDEILKAATELDPRKIVNEWSDEVPYTSDQHALKASNVNLSPKTINAIAMEVWFEHQRWGFLYKLRKNFDRHVSRLLRRP